MTSQTAEQTVMVTLTIDDMQVSVPKGTTVYQAAVKLGIELPIFCYQDRMPPFGACRVCLVEVEKMPKLQTSCTLQATEGMVVRTRSKQAVEGRESILEFLLINHPLDCPICDRGGECPLQDQTLKYGPGLSRFFEEKRRFKKPLSLGPVLTLDRERCIICARCVRFGDHIAGDHALEFKERGYRSEVGTPDDEPAKSKFIGNTIMICPVGALTSRVYRFRARPWDNDQAATTCMLCPVGCSMTIDSRDGDIMRTRSRENLEVNDIWLCDKGWFGYEYTTHPGRLAAPLIRKDGALVETTWENAISHVVAKLKMAKGKQKIAGIGGAPLTVEENYLFQKLIREIGQSSNVDYRLNHFFSLEEEGLPPGMEHSIGDLEHVQSALLLGFNITEEYPVIWLRLKQAINKGAKAAYLGHYGIEIASYLTKNYLHVPGKEMEALQQHFSELESLVQGKSVVFVGSQYLNSPNRKQILSKIVELKQKNPALTINIMDANQNSMGARWAGMHPELKPYGTKADRPGLNTRQVIEQGAASGWDFLLVAGADIAAKMPSKLWKDFRDKLGFLVVQELFLTETAADADVVLPTLTFLEKVGSFMNIEGRVQSIHAGKNIPDGVYSDAEIFEMIANKFDQPLNIENQFFNRLHVEKIARDSNISFAPPTANQPQELASGELSGTFVKILFDHGTRMLHNKHLLQLSNNPCAQIHPLDAQKYGIKENDQVLLTSGDKTIKARINLIDTLVVGTIVLPLGFKELPVYEFGPDLWNGISFTLKREEANVR